MEKRSIANSTTSTIYKSLSTTSTSNSTTITKGNCYSINCTTSTARDKTNSMATT